MHVCIIDKLLLAIGKHTKLYCLTFYQKCTQDFAAGINYYLGFTVQSCICVSIVNHNFVVFVVDYSLK